MDDKDNVVNVIISFGFGYNRYVIKVKFFLDRIFGTEDADYAAALD